MLAAPEDGRRRVVSTPAAGVPTWRVMARSCASSLTMVRVDAMTHTVRNIDRHLTTWGPFAPDVVDLTTARQHWREIRRFVGLSDTATDLLTGHKAEGNQAKLDKAAPDGRHNVGITLSPASEAAAWLHDHGAPNVFADIAGVHLSPRATTCNGSTAGCRDACLAGSGQMAFTAQTLARVARTLLLVAYPHSFATIVANELHRIGRRHGALAIRPDVTSDLTWWEILPWLSDHGIVYGYTKRADKVRTARTGWRLTVSAHERTTLEQIREHLAAGRNVAVPFALGRHEPMPTTWQGMPVLDGDEHDHRYLDPVGHIVGLRAKIGNGNRSAITSSRVEISGTFIRAVA